MKYSKDYNDLLKKLVVALEKREISVDFVNDPNDKVGIAELKNNRFYINLSARDTVGIIITLGHLFGHLVQFMNYDKYRYLVEGVKKPKPLVLSEDFKKAFHGYELEAFRIGKGLIEEVQPFDDEFERFYQNYERTDFEHFWHYITTGEKGDIEYFDLMLEENFKKIKNEVLTPFDPLPAPQKVEFVGQEGVVD